MSREYTFDNTARNISFDDIFAVIKRLIDAEKIVVGRSFDPNDYVISIGTDIVKRCPDTPVIFGISVKVSLSDLPTRIALIRRRTINPAYYDGISIPKNSGRYPWGTDSDNIINLMNMANKQNLIKDVIFNDPATIVYWVDGTKTVVKAHNEKFDPEKGLAMAICKRFLGSNKSGANFNNIFKKWLPKQKESNSDTNVKGYGKDEPLRWMTVAEVAEELGCSKALVQEECRKGLYPGAFKENGKWLIPVPRLKKRGDKNE